MTKQIHQGSNLKSKVLTALTVVSLAAVPIVWKVPNILPLVAAGGFASSAVYYRKVGYIPSKLEKQFIETQNKLSEQQKALDGEALKLETDKRNLRKEFEKWRDGELERIEKSRVDKLSDAELIINGKLQEVERLAQSKLSDVDNFIAARTRELDSRAVELAQQEENLEGRALAIAERIKQAEQESIERVEARDKAGREELEHHAAVLEEVRLQLERERENLAQEKQQLLKDIEELERQWQQKFLEQEERHQEDYKQLELVYTNVAGTYAAENWALKRPDYFDPPSSTEEYAANDVMRLLAQYDVFAKAPILKSDDRGFRLSFKVLPVKHKVRGEEIEEKSLSAGEAYKIISGKLLPDLATDSGTESH